MTTKQPRILAIDPGTRHLGVAVLNGHGLHYYTVKDFHRHRPAEELVRATRAVILELLRRFQPDILAYEKAFYVQEMNSALLQVQQREIARIGHATKVRVIGSTPAHVRKVICGNGRATKQAVADVLVLRFPELAAYRRPGDLRRERYWLNMFDAVALAVTCADEVNARAPTAKGACAA